MLVLFQPHLYSRTLHLAHEFAVALAGADAVCVTEIYPAREQPLPGVSGRLDRRRARASYGPGCGSAGRRRSRTALRLVAGWARTGRHAC